MPETTPRAPRRRRLSDTSRPALLITAAAGAAWSVAGWIAAGTSGLSAGLLATALVVAFFGSAMVPLAVAGRARSGALAGYGVVILTYSLRFAVVLLVLGAAAGMGAVDDRWLGLSIMVCALAYTSAHAVAVLRDGTGRPTGASGPADRPGP